MAFRDCPPGRMRWAVICKNWKNRVNIKDTSDKGKVWKEASESALMTRKVRQKEENMKQKKTRYLEWGFVAAILVFTFLWAAVQPF